MKWCIGVLGGVGLILLSGCSFMPATYQVPDYYETKNVPYHYKVGEVYKIKDLREGYLLKKQKQQQYFLEASKRKKQAQAEEALQREARLKENNGWITHRTYKKQYFFE